MKLSDNGLRLLKEWEGCKLRTYRDAGGKLTIGCGHLLTPEELVGGKYDDGITEQEALDLLAADVNPAEDAVNRYVKLNLFPHEFDALVCFVFNVGVGAFASSTLLKVLNRGDYIDVPKELRKWVKVDGKRCQGLASRREKEIQLWKGNLSEG